MERGREDVVGGRRELGLRPRGDRRGDGARAARLLEREPGRARPAIVATPITRPSVEGGSSAASSAC